MFQTERVPVTVYRSTDEGAPQLSAAAGSLKTVLKACLTNGYGTKQPLGWEMQYENGHAACWRSKHNRATGAVLSVDNAAGGYAKIGGFMTATSAKEGGKDFGAGFFPYFPYSSSPADTGWVLVGHGRGFIFAVINQNLNRCPILYFGDFPSLAAADAQNAVLGYLYNSSEGDSTSYSATYWFMRDYLDNSSVSAATQSVADIYGDTYPSAIANGFSAADIYLTEGKGGENRKYSLRGLLPGVLRIAETMPAASSLPTNTAFELGGDSYLYFRLGGNEKSLLVNSDAWEL